MIKAVAVIKGDKKVSCKPNPNSAGNNKPIIVPTCKPLLDAFTCESIEGTIKFEQNMNSNNKETIIRINLKNVPYGAHGFHIHEFGDTTNGCTSTGPHFNPFNKTHGAPMDVNRHVGDLGNIEANMNGIINTVITDNQINLSGPYSVVGRSIVIHADADDFGKGGHEDSMTSGHAGARIACGVIALTK